MAEERPDSESVEQEAIDETPNYDEKPKKRQSSAIGRIWQSLFGSNRHQRLNELSDAINIHPDAAVNYVLRGEIYAQMGDTEAAQVDFEKALALIATQKENDRWGITAQALQDRALRALQQIG